jgi:hypothetical protein
MELLTVVGVGILSGLTGAFGAVAILRAQRSFSTRANQPIEQPERIALREQLTGIDENVLDAMATLSSINVHIDERFGMHDDRISILESALRQQRVPTKAAGTG